MTTHVTVIGNFSIDLIDDNPPSPGGCPSFAGLALAELGEHARILTASAPDDLPLFADVIAALTVPCDVVAAQSTSSFGLRYAGGDERVLTVEAIGPKWTAETVATLTGWVHFSPLLRSDVTLGALNRLAENGCLIALDGQGLVRVPHLGPLRFDDDYDPLLLRNVSVLKLAAEEAEIVAGRRFDRDSALALGVPEILVTHGSGGCDLYVDGRMTHVPAAWRVHDVHPTGAGDMFTTYYVVARATGLSPRDAAHRASRFAAERLQERKLATSR